MIADHVPSLIKEWDAAIDRLLAEPGKLQRAFMKRWFSNAISSPPDGLPPSVALAEAHGWSCALETYLLARDVPDQRSSLLKEVIAGAAKIYTGGHGDAWLADILALRRVPLPAGAQRKYGLKAMPGIEIAQAILGNVAKISRELPVAEPAAYRFFRRRYEMLSEALVSEIVDPDEAGPVALDVQSGARPVPANARSVFSAIAGLGRPWLFTPQERQGVQLVKDLWANQIGELSDSIALLNDGLIELGAERSGWEARGEETELEAAQQALARQFDRAFFRFLAADNPHRENHNRSENFSLLRALDRLSKASPAAVFGPAAGIIAPETARGILWEAREAESAVVYDASGTVVVEGELGARLKQFEDRIHEEIAWR